LFDSNVRGDHFLRGEGQALLHHPLCALPPSDFWRDLSFFFGPLLKTLVIYGHKYTVTAALQRAGLGLVFSFCAFYIEMCDLT